MAPLPSLIPPCQAADPWVCMSGSPCRGHVRGLHALGGQLGLAENERQSHREAAGMRRADELFGLDAGLALEAAAEAVGIVLERAALGRDGAFAVLDSAPPDGRSMGLHVRFSLSWPRPRP